MENNEKCAAHAAGCPLSPHYCQRRRAKSTKCGRRVSKTRQDQSEHEISPPILPKCNNKLAKKQENSSNTDNGDGKISLHLIINNDYKL